MLTNVRINLNVVESMIYYWEASKSGEKVGERYISSIATADGMKLAYDDEFTAESVRRALSAISNREIFSGKSLKEKRFWSNNMWMMDDLGYMQSMVQPIKTLNLDQQLQQLQELDNPRDYDAVEVFFLPLHVDVYNIINNKLVINFFKVKPDIMGGEGVTIEGQDFQEFVVDKIKEVLK